MDKRYTKKGYLLQIPRIAFVDFLIFRNYAVNKHFTVLLLVSLIVMISLEDVKLWIDILVKNAIFCDSKTYINNHPMIGERKNITIENVKEQIDTRVALCSDGII